MPIHHGGCGTVGVVREVNAVRVEKSGSFFMPRWNRAVRCGGWEELEGVDYY